MAKTTADRIAALEAELTEKRTRLAKLKAKETAAERKRDARRKIVVGAAVLAHAQANPAFDEALREVLRRAVTREADKAVIADLLEPQEAKA